MNLQTKGHTWPLIALEFSFDGGGVDGGHGFGGFEGMCFGLLCDDFRFFFAEEFSLVKGFDVLFEYFSFLIGVILWIIGGDLYFFVL